MYHVFQLDIKAISRAQPLKLSKIEDISTANFRLEVTFIEARQSVLSYAQVVEEKYGVRFVDVCIIDIVDDMIYS